MKMLKMLKTKWDSFCKWFWGLEDLPQALIAVPTIAALIFLFTMTAVSIFGTPVSTTNTKTAITDPNLYFHSYKFFEDYVVELSPDWKVEIAYGATITETPRSKLISKNYGGENPYPKSIIEHARNEIRNAIIVRLRTHAAMDNCLTYDEKTRTYLGKLRSNKDDGKDSWCWKELEQPIQENMGLSLAGFKVKRATLSYNSVRVVK